ncbi:Zinc knuckle [Rhizoctonia solani]|uniref:Zinc knuckle n=1 Tax=Rhizoctonia solani TaxID=456999 RepID=A0A8H7M7F3_9AGAM|nr:Zinc knuckle [Rhizoctonia solani]
MSSPPATAVSSPARNGRDHINGDREKTPMSGEPAHTNGASNGDSGPVQHADDNPPAPSSEHSGNDSHSQKRGDKQIKPNKVYIGGLPEQTRQEDLQACFGKIGTIVSIELKLGYGFVEFDSREAAEESVAKYHEGYFMGNKIRVELSHGGGRTAKYVGEPGACFKCGTHGHWARECPHNVVPGLVKERFPQDPKLNSANRYKGRDDRADRKDYHHPPPYARDYPPYRGDEYARYAASRDRYMDYYAPPPPRDYRDRLQETLNAPAPYRDDRAYYSHYESMPPPPRDVAYRSYGGAVDRGRAPYPPGYPPAPAPARRDDYDRASSRDYPPPPAEYRSSHPPYRRRSTSPGHSRYPPDQRYASGYSGYPSSYSSGPPMPSSSRSGPPPARREASGY